MRHFLAQTDRDALLAAICAGTLPFTQSTVTRAGVRAEDDSYRISQMCHDFPPWQEVFATRITALLPLFLQCLEVAPFVLAQVECQLTHTGHGGYFRLHNDDGDPLSSTRVITFVYYVHCLPKMFTGGQLAFACGTMIEPEDNTLIAFPSNRLHEIRPVTCEPNTFELGRFTINGWLRKI